MPEACHPRQRNTQRHIVQRQDVGPEGLFQHLAGHGRHGNRSVLHRLLTLGAGDDNFLNPFCRASIRQQKERQEDRNENAPNGARALRIRTSPHNMRVIDGSLLLG